MGGAWRWGRALARRRAARAGVRRLKRPPAGPCADAGLTRSTAARSAKPLQIWDKKVRNGHIKRITDSDIQSSVLEIAGTNVSTTFITCPADAKQTLGIKLPFLVMIIKNVRSARARAAGGRAAGRGCAARPRFLTRGGHS